jgi:hypothetical protein
MCPFRGLLAACPSGGWYTEGIASLAARPHGHERAVGGFQTTKRSSSARRFPVILGVLPADGQAELKSRSERTHGNATQEPYISLAVAALAAGAAILVRSHSRGGRSAVSCYSCRQPANRAASLTINRGCLQSSCFRSAPNPRRPSNRFRLDVRGLPVATTELREPRRSVAVTSV